MAAVIPDHPITEAEKQEALEAVLASNVFSRSAQLRALLRHICETERAGHTDQLTEYQIAVDVLGRPKDVNVSEDSTVRNRAYELRQRLEKYYSIETPDAPVRIKIPRGGYVPYYERHHPADTASPDLREATRQWRRWSFGAGLLALGLAVGIAVTWFTSRPSQPAVLREAWGPIAKAGDDFLLAISTNLYMTVRPHISPHPRRYPVPEDVYEYYGPNRPLASGTRLFMEPAQLSVPMGELAAAVDICAVRQMFGGTCQILPESEAPVAALRGRNVVLIGSNTNSLAATVLLKSLPFAIDYNQTDQFAVFDRRKPAGQDQVYISQPTGDPIPSVIYGLITVIGSVDGAGHSKRTIVFSGGGSAGVQGAVEFLSSPNSLQELKQRFASEGQKGFPSTYQVVVRCRTSGVRLIAYEYAAHAVIPSAGQH